LNLLTFPILETKLKWITFSMVWHPYPFLQLFGCLVLGCLAFSVY
jgi:hypothetical protein